MSNPQIVMKDRNISQPHLTHNEQGVKTLFGKRYRWERDTPRSPLRLVPAEPQEIAVSIDGTDLLTFDGEPKGSET